MIDLTLVTKGGLIQQRQQQSFLHTTICVDENSSNHGDQICRWGLHDAVVVTTVVRIGTVVVTTVDGD